MPVPPILRHRQKSPKNIYLHANRTCTVTFPHFHRRQRGQRDRQPYSNAGVGSSMRVRAAIERVAAASSRRPLTHHAGCAGACSRRRGSGITLPAPPPSPPRLLSRRISTMPLTVCTSGLTRRCNSPVRAADSPSSLMTPSHRGKATSAATPSDALKDEYGNLDASGQTYVVPHFTTESGATMRDVEVRYNTFGRLNEARDNVMVVCHALTGNARLDTWWSSLLGPGQAFDTDKYFVVCANILGSCYGTTGPMSRDPATGQVYGPRFPHVTIRDTVRLHMRMLKEAVGVRSVASVVGGSMGGMQALEWAFLGLSGGGSPGAEAGESGESFVKSAVVIACGARHTAWQIGISETQRQAIYADPNWQGGAFDPAAPPVQGLAVARQIAMFSYRTSHGFENKFGRARAEDGRYEVRRYLEYQGQKFLSRFDALTYVRLTEKMDSHDVGRDRGGVDAALRSLRIPVLVVGIDSDVLYPLHEQEEMAGLIPMGELKVVQSRNGHDAFLLEQQQVGGAIAQFLRKHQL